MRKFEYIKITLGRPAAGAVHVQGLCHCSAAPISNDQGCMLASRNCILVHNACESALLGVDISTSPHVLGSQQDMHTRQC